MEHNFIMVYSFGKDSTLALHKMIAAEYKPAALLVFCDKIKGHTMIHHFPRDYIRKYEECLGIPFETAGMYQNRDLPSVLRNVLRLQQKYHTNIFATGDIDQPSAIAWNHRVADLAGIDLRMPLNNMQRTECVNEIIDLGYKCLITALDDKCLPDTLLGRELNEETLELIQRTGVDICGENGEYHTMVVDGPLFMKPLAYTLQPMENDGDRRIMKPVMVSGSIDNV